MRCSHECHIWVNRFGGVVRDVRDTHTIGALCLSRDVLMTYATRDTLLRLTAPIAAWLSANVDLIRRILIWLV
jgi:hypothetical protein